MKVLIACDKFKGALGALEVCRVIAKGMLNSNPFSKITIHLLADGEDGTMAILNHYTSLKTIN